MRTGCDRAKRLRGSSRRCDQGPVWGHECPQAAILVCADHQALVMMPSEAGRHASHLARLQLCNQAGLRRASPDLSLNLQSVDIPDRSVV